MKIEIKAGMEVKCVKQNFGQNFVGRQGIVTSIGQGVLPIHVRLFNPLSENGIERTETDFAENELMVIR